LAISPARSAGNKSNARWAGSIRAETKRQFLKIFFRRGFGAGYGLASAGGPHGGSILASDGWRRAKTKKLGKGGVWPSCGGVRGGRPCRGFWLFCLDGTAAEKRGGFVPADACRGKPLTAGSKGQPGGDFYSLAGGKYHKGTRGARGTRSGKGSLRPHHRSHGTRGDLFCLTRRAGGETFLAGPGKRGWAERGWQFFGPEGGTRPWLRKGLGTGGKLQGRAFFPLRLDEFTGPLLPRIPGKKRALWLGGGPRGAPTPGKRGDRGDDSFAAPPFTGGRLGNKGEGAGAKVVCVRELAG